MGSQPEIASSGYEYSMKMDGRAKDRENYYTLVDLKSVSAVHW